MKLYRNIFPLYLKGGQKEKKIIWFMRKSISMMQKKRRMNNQFNEKEEWKTSRRKKIFQAGSRIIDTIADKRELSRLAKYIHRIARNCHSLHQVIIDVYFKSNLKCRINFMANAACMFVSLCLSLCLSVYLSQIALSNFNELKTWFYKMIDNNSFNRFWGHSFEGFKCCI